MERWGSVDTAVSLTRQPAVQVDAKVEVLKQSGAAGIPKGHVTADRPTQERWTESSMVQRQKGNWSLLLVETMIGNVALCHEPM